MKKILFITIMLLTVNAYSQKVFSGTLNNPAKNYTEGLEKAPDYPGGIPKFFAYVNDSFKPTASGMIIAEFTVDTDGKVTDIKITKSLNKKTDQRLIEVLQKSPLWTPGYHEGQPVKVRYTYPLRTQG